MISRFSFSILTVLFITLITSTTDASTVYFYRLRNMFMSGSNCMISVNDSIKFTLTNGSYYKLETNAPSIEILASYENLGIKNLKIEQGKTYYIQLEFKNMSSLILTLRDEYSGKAAIERLDADKEAKDLDTESLKLILITTIAPKPVANPDSIKIYLFRPFNITGVSGNVKISDGEYIYELKNYSSYVINTLKTDISFSTVKESIHTSNTSISMKLQKGKVYYVAVLRSGGAYIVTEANEDYAKKEMKLP